MDSVVSSFRPLVTPVVSELIAIVMPLIFLFAKSSPPQLSLAFRECFLIGLIFYLPDLAGGVHPLDVWFHCFEFLILLIRIRYIFTAGAEDVSVMFLCPVDQISGIPGVDLLQRKTP